MHDKSGVVERRGATGATPTDVRQVMLIVLGAYLFLGMR